MKQGLSNDLLRGNDEPFTGCTPALPAILSPNGVHLSYGGLGDALMNHAEAMCEMLTRFFFACCAIFQYFESGTLMVMVFI